MSNDEPKLTIFVSSMIGPLWDERVIIEEAIRTGIPLARAWVFERAPASSEEITESYLTRVRECDIYLLILGDDISGPVKDEYQTARECHKPRLCFVQEGVERTEALKEFLSTLQVDVKYAMFSDEASLQREVLRAVRLELVEGYKRYRLGEAERAQLVASIAALAPRPPDYFVGRREILDELKTGLAPGSAQAITALQGMGGIGKTATAQQLALEIEADFPGGVFWADLPRHGGDPSPVLDAWATLCGHDVASLADPQARAQVVRGMLGARLRDRGRLVVVLDDVREGWLEGAQTLKAALPPGVPVVVTTRDEDLAHALGAEVRWLDALPMDDALALLSRLAGAESVEAELTEARALAERMGRLPLGLELAGKLAARYARKPGWRLATLRAQVEAKAAEVLKLRGHPGLAATFAVSYEALKEEQQRLFRALGAFAPVPLAAEHVAAVLGWESKATEEKLDTLVTLSLVRWERRGIARVRYTLHPLLHEFADRLTPENKRESFHLQLENNVIKSLEDPTHRHERAITAGECLLVLGWPATKMRPAVLEALRELMCSEQRPEMARRAAASLLTRLRWLVDIRDVPPEEILTYLELFARYVSFPVERFNLVKTINQILEMSLPDRVRAQLLVYRAVMLGQSGESLNDVHLLDAAAEDYEAAKQIVAKLIESEASLLEDYKVAARVGLGSGNIAKLRAEGLTEAEDRERRQKLLYEAVKLYQAAAQSAQAYGQDVILEAHIYQELSWTYALLQNWAEAEESYRIALEVLERGKEKVEDPKVYVSHYAQVLEMASDVHLKKGHSSQVFAEYETAYQLAQKEIVMLRKSFGESGDPGLVFAHITSGDCLWAMSEHPDCDEPQPLAEKARAHWQTALDIARRLGMSEDVVAKHSDFYGCQP